MRHAIAAFLFKQMLTWPLGLMVVKKDYITYPVRFFKKENKSSFSFEYFIYTALCAIFNIKYPEKYNSFVKLLYIVFYAGIMTLGEVAIERYTNLIKYRKWKWYWSFQTLGITNYLSRIFYKWFFREDFTSQSAEFS
ncbi:CBO0543 family protein [Evansella clarkii]|uniref:CBO0543 family protein n=1 Tax=Evansella clarkii TaxID=79879 RepID=UPI0030B82A75